MLNINENRFSYFNAGLCLVSCVINPQVFIPSAVAGLALGLTFEVVAQVGGKFILQIANFYASKVKDNPEQSQKVFSKINEIKTLLEIRPGKMTSIINTISVASNYFDRFPLFKVMSGVIAGNFIGRSIVQHKLDFLPSLTP